MLFSVEYDRGSSISAYLVPDSGGTVPSVRIKSNGVELLRMEANDPRDELVEAGRHSTGLCGFMIDDSVVPDLASRTDLEITEAETDLVIYRRPRPSFIQDMKVFRLETHLLPLWRIDDALKDSFQYWYKGIDRRGFETSNQVFCGLDAQSVFISGRLFVKTIETYLTLGFKSAVIFRNPYEELAERLIILKSITPKTVELLGPRDALTFEPVMAHLADLEHFDEDSCRRFFKRAPESVLAPLVSPFIRQLTAFLPDEMPKKGSIAPALRTLAAFDVIGLRSDAAHFSHALADLLGLEQTTLPVMDEYARVIDLGARLKAIRDVEGLLERDLEIYHHATEAFGEVARELG